ncbi:MAG: twin-arginine translocase TatA/TatE family subunit [Bacteroidales bacterium]
MDSILLFFNISGGELLIIVVAIYLVFGPKKIPEFARMLGKGINELRRATNDIKNEITREANKVKSDVNVDIGIDLDDPLSTKAKPKSKPSQQTQTAAEYEEETKPEQPKGTEPYTQKPVNDPPTDDQDLK